MLSCEEKVLEPKHSGGTTPGKISIDSVVNLPGAAKIYYTLPNNSDLLYAIAKYNNGLEEIEKKVSFYSSNVFVDGFFSEKEFEVNLCGVNREGSMGEYTTVKVAPTEAPAKQAAKTLKILAGFGGPVFVWDNPTEAPLTFAFSYKDSLGNITPIDWVDNNLASSYKEYKGFPAEETEYYAYVIDRYNNVSDTVTNKVGVIEEEEILGLGANNVLDLESDYKSETWFTYGAHQMFSEKLGWKECPAFQFPNKKGFLTFDMGDVVKISTIIWRDRSGKEFKPNSPQTIRVWGTNTLPTTTEEQDDMLNNWTLITDLSKALPSGNEATNPTEQDWAIAKSGFPLTFPVPTPAFRYYRFKVLDQYLGADYLAIGYLRIFKPVDK
jgi:hypothetical protein